MRPAGRPDHERRHLAPEARDIGRRGVGFDDDAHPGGDVVRIFGDGADVEPVDRRGFGVGRRADVDVESDGRFDLGRGVRWVERDGALDAVVGEERERRREQVRSLGQPEAAIERLRFAATAPRRGAASRRPRRSAADRRPPPQPTRHGRPPDARPRTFGGFARPSGPSPRSRRASYPRRDGTQQPLVTELATRPDRPAARRDPDRASGRRAGRDRLRAARRGGDRDHPAATRHRAAGTRRSVCRASSCSERVSLRRPSGRGSTRSRWLSRSRSAARSLR